MTTDDLARRLGPFDATMLVMGGIVGAGIFANPAVVARAVGSPGMILLAWGLGGVIALAGAFVYAELATWRPDTGGQYAYIRDAFHPMVAFLYGWTMLFVIQTGGMAGAAMIFGAYVRELTGLAAPPALIAMATLALLTVINCLGARAGGSVQNALMLTKIVAIVALVTLGWLALGRDTTAPLPDATPAEGRGPLLAVAAAMVPVLFAYGGWQTASFVSGELRDPARDLPRGLFWGVLGVIALYLAVNVICLVVLGAGGLAATQTPASDVMQRALGPAGAKLLAAAIAISTVGFLSQSMLTAPRVYFAMARDGLFFEPVGRVHPRTRAPVVAIALQGVLAALIALSGRYDEILGYVVAMDATFFGLTGAALLVFRARERRGGQGPRQPGARMPGHPWTTLLFVGAFWTLAITTVVQFPRSAGVGALIVLAGAPVYLVWRRLTRR